MIKRIFWGAAAAAVALFPSLTSGHAILLFPTSRQTGTQMSFTDVGIKIATFPPTAAQLNSCLDSTPVAPQEAFVAGSDVTVKWSITIPHQNPPGVRVAVQYDPQSDFIVLQDNIDVNALSATLSLPADKSSDTAVLQWLWASQEDGGFYMACSDVMIKPAAAGNTGLSPQEPVSPSAATPAGC
ncbi:uncharacterized protein SPPG_01985 [Spizellomyces punctatus DAOM BR117]|uniref:Uncharacterized protein n=1 Tax=Spizellomyces punctatus (strain DAOM BR117) TaxID=645134 RepID=A0A0L0HPL0_SPIPD|nr:uncharacterized protein SPPG_01985 [Spizellomyces punctatus DAOM BR117]KND02905.1 hypothetical protein SPPG_01985 [Spizellomyces punctatus DAOM BR117]|eukprot:XP_016610944.1 hypothetical protein SPPG_01985 [Spizellomyces punctatus DAOM BR117]